MPMDKIIPLHTQTTEDAIRLKNMKAELEAERIRSSYAKMLDERKVKDALSIDPDKDYKPGTISEENKKFLKSVSQRMPFINDIMSECICVAANTIYLIGAVTGGGKSTAVANIIYPILQQNKKILVISNEERRNHVYVRVACRNLGLSFFKWTKNWLTVEQNEAISEEAERLEQFMTVIGTDYQKNPSFTCTPEGLEIVFNKYCDNHDVILFDYFQNISRSTNNPDPNVWMHQEKFCYFINEFKNRFEGPIFILSQLWPANKKNTIDFLERIKGRKMIGDVSPVHVEIRTNKEDFTSMFVVHKDRLWNSDGLQIMMGFDREASSYVPYTESFKQRAAKWIAARVAAAAGDETIAQTEEAKKLADEIASFDSEHDEHKESAQDELDIDGMYT